LGLLGLRLFISLQPTLTKYHSGYYKILAAVF
jgi:hypothetical protein